MSEFKTIQAHVDDIRILVRQTMDDSPYSDQYIYKKLLDSRAYILHNEFNKFRKISEWNYQSFCLPLEISTYHDCDCIDDIGCKVMKSTVPIPKPLQSRYKNFFEITNITGSKRYSKVTPAQLKRNKYTFTKKLLKGYDIVNDYLVLFDMSGISIALVRGIWEDPSEIASIGVCGTDQVTPCYNILTDNFPLDSYLVNPVYEFVIKTLTFSSSLKNDISNNAQPEPQR